MDRDPASAPINFMEYRGFCSQDWQKQLLEVVQSGQVRAYQGTCVSHDDSDDYCYDSYLKPLHHKMTTDIAL